MAANTRAWFVKKPVLRSELDGEWRSASLYGDMGAVRKPMSRLNPGGKSSPGQYIVNIAK